MLNQSIMNAVAILASFSGVTLPFTKDLSTVLRSVFLLFYL